MLYILYNRNNITLIICTVNFIVFFTKIANSKKIKLVLTSFYSPNQEIPLGSSQKPICIDH